LTLAVALLKGEKFDLVVQKATELGARASSPS
jgi:16S rRNA U1498 N3-methylase RsmE